MKRWKPKKGQAYYYLTGILDIIEDSNTYSVVDDIRIKIGNCFETRIEAFQMAKKFRQLLKQEYKQTLEKSK
jgi:hypothetical protein